MAETDGSSAGRSRWVVLGALLFLQFAMGLSFLAVAPLFPLIIDDLGISRASASLLVGATSLGVALALVPASVLPARVGTRAAVAVGGGLMSAMLLTPLASAFAFLVGARLVFALGAAVLLSALPAVLVRWFVPRELAFVNGLGIVAQTLGVATSMSGAASLATAIGWEGALGALGAITAAATLLWLAASAGRGPAAAGSAALSLREVRDVARDPVVVLLGIGFAGALGTNISFASWLPAYFSEAFGFSLERAGASASVLTLFGMVGSLLGSVLPLRIPRRKPFLLLAGLLLPAAGFGSIVSASPVVLYTSLALFGIASAIYIPVMLTIPMEFPRIGPSRAGVAVAVILGAGNLSGFVLPLVIGTVRDVSGSFVPGLAAAGCLALVLAAVALVLPETGPVRTRAAEGAREVV